jgi:catechol 2,3-dioxygenase
MASPRSTTADRPKTSRTLLIWVASVVVVALTTAGIWWGVAAASSSEPAGPAASALPDSTRMGSVELVTDELAPMRAFYVDAVGLEVLAEDPDRLSLGSGGDEVLSIARADDRAADVPAEAGLYHSAILYPDEQSLARTLLNVATLAPTSYTGSADHAVSLAFYFSDPDGNGLELYSDTPEDEWVWENGLVQMGSAPLDPNAFLQEHLGATSTNAVQTMGHVHLRVGDLEKARAFYADLLGFAVTAETQGALFFAAGGYHHHLAANTWSSAGATDRPESLGLGGLTVHLGDEDALAAAADRLTDAGATFTQDAGVLTVDDPWGNTVRLLAS